MGLTVPAPQYKDGDVIQHPAGTWYIHENGNWRLMTEKEVSAYVTQEKLA